MGGPTTQHPGDLSPPLSQCVGVGLSCGSGLQEQMALLGTAEKNWEGCAVLKKPESVGTEQQEAEKMQSGRCRTEMCFQTAFQTNRPDVGTCLLVWEKAVFF